MLCRMAVKGKEEELPAEDPTTSKEHLRPAEQDDGSLHHVTDANDLQKLAARQQGSHCGVPKRLMLVMLSCLGLAISYADRSNIAIAIIPMSKEFNWDPAIEGAIFSCFFYGYMATQLLGGYVADRLGGKYVFAAGKETP